MFFLFCKIIFQDVRIEFDGFEQLFSRYLLESVDHSSIDWQEIKPPPEETVNSNKILKFSI